MKTSAAARQDSRPEHSHSIGAGDGARHAAQLLGVTDGQVQQLLDVQLLVDIILYSHADEDRVSYGIFSRIRETMIKNR